MKLRNLIAAALIGSMAFSAAPAYAFSSGSSSSQQDNTASIESDLHIAAKARLILLGYQQSDQAEEYATAYAFGTGQQRAEIRAEVEAQGGRLQVLNGLTSNHEADYDQWLSIPQQNTRSWYGGADVAVMHYTYIRVDVHLPARWV